MTYAHRPHVPKIILPIVAAALMLPRAASADTFCVIHAGCHDPGHNFTTIQAAVDAAAGNDEGGIVHDTILVGVGEFDPFSSWGNPIEVAGSGPGTVVRISGDIGDNQSLAVLGDSADTMHDLTVRLPTGRANIGVYTFGALDRVHVTSVGQQPQGTGIRAASRFENGTVSVPGGTGIAGRIHGSTLVRRADIEANWGIYASGVSSMRIEDSIVRIVGDYGIGIFAGDADYVYVDTQVAARHVDLIADSLEGTTGVTVSAGGFVAGVKVSADVRSSIVRGFGKNFAVRTGRPCPTPTCAPGQADLTVAYSNFDPSVSNEGVFDSETGNVSADPGFVSPTDLRPRADSALVDAGDPNSPSAVPDPPESTIDRDGLPRAVDGDGDGNPRADIGAFEYQRSPAAACAVVLDPFERARCAIDELLDPDLCESEAPSPKLLRAVGKRVSKARAATVRAATVTRRGRLIRLVTRASVQLDKLAVRVTRSNGTPDACKATLDALIVECRALVTALVN